MGYSFFGGVADDVVLYRELFKGEGSSFDVASYKALAVVSITSIERTIVDSLTSKSLVSPRLGIEALKRAIFEKKTPEFRVGTPKTDFGNRPG